MALPPLLQNLALPVVGAPMFIISCPNLVIAQCKAGIVGSFPALNARPVEVLDRWLIQITEELDRWNQENPETPAAPYAVNQIVHRSNTRLEKDLEICVKHQVPITITSLGAREDVYKAVHSYGGIVFHDVTNNMYAQKAISKGADGLIAVAAGAGGHGGTLSPFALISEIREWFHGPLLLSGALSTGAGILAALALGADLAYIGSAFIATEEANANPGYQQALIDGVATDIVYTNFFTGIHGNYLRSSIEAAGLDPDHLSQSDPSKMNFGNKEIDGKKPWKDIWGCGQGIGSIKSVTTVSEYVAQLSSEYRQAIRRLWPDLAEK